MELFKNTTDLIGLKDNNITISFVLKHQTHIEIRAKLDYQAPACLFCRGNMIKYDFQKSSTIPILDVQGMPTLLKLKKRRFQCKNCHKVVISQTSLVRKNHQISQPVWAKITQLLTESLSNAPIARQCHVSVATVQRQLENFQIKETFNKLPAILSWDEFSRNKGQLAFIAQDFETRQIVTVLEDNKQTTIKNFFYKFPRKARETVEVVTVDMSGSYIPIIKKLFPNARIVLDRFHIIQHLSRAMMSTRIAIMKSFDTQSLPYRAMKNHWRILQKDSRKLSLETFYSRTFRQTLTPREVVQKTLPFSEELRYYYDLYQLLLFHFQEKQVTHFFDLIEEHLGTVNKEFHTVFKTFLRYKDYIINALELPYSNAKLEATNKLIKDIKRQAFGFKTFKNFKTKIIIALNTQKERTGTILSRC
ncbi:ISL3 family transposase [Streptococcus pluranimalium]|uniref:ISL3 family transposase n=2 Tax=Streptococcus pluranimalium TaxID=82348 RepID=UPI002414EEDA|nr:ISL3 family transposase [Streptococcus pluranimalium]WFM79996.1 ISL3 family transposase [Streptococcus pluranimalium]